MRFKVEGPAGLIACKAAGRIPKIDDAHHRALVARVGGRPVNAVDGVVRWRLVDLA